MSKLDAEAYLDAALMLVQEGAKLQYQNFGNTPPRQHMWLVSPGERYVAAQTPALALLAAILRAQGGKDAD